jgi:ABC-type dipeptide/oligopeptide/nickel transport system permease component
VPPLIRYIAFRLALVAPVLLAILAVTFVVTHVLPGDPAVRAAGPYATAADVRIWREKLGLDKPIGVQLLTYLRDLVHGDLGTSNFTGRSVAADLAARLPSTLELITLSTFLACIFGVGLAIMSTARRGGVGDYLARFYGALGTAVPDYVIVLVLILVFYSIVRLLPAPIGQAGPTAPAVPHVSGAYFIDAVLAGNFAAMGDAVRHLILPVATKTFVAAAPVYRVARAAIEEARRGQYVDYALLMGGSRRLILRYTLENAFPPVLTIIGTIYSVLLGSAVIVETVVGWGGIGQYGVQAVQNNDYFAIQGFVLMAALFSVAVFLIVDLCHAALDPRVRASL